MRTPAIWYVFPRMNTGGAEKHVLELAGRLRSRGFDAGILTIFEEGELASAIRAAGIPLECLHEKSWNPGTFFKLYHWMRGRRIDILHTYLFGFHLFAGIPAKLLHVPVVLSSRRELAHWQKPRHRWLENLGNRFVDKVICCSHAAEVWTLDKEKVTPDRVLTIHNGVDDRWFENPDAHVDIRRELGIPENALVVGTVANFSYEKGYPYLLEAAEIVHQTHPDVWFLFVGSGPLQQEMIKKSSALKASGRFIFAGRRTDVRELIHSMDIFVLASVIEGFPNVLLEAMACGRKVVATRAGGIPELVKHQVNGLLAEPRSGRELAAAVMLLIRDRELGHLLAAGAFETICKHFTMQRMMDQYVNFYHNELIKKQMNVPLVPNQSETEPELGARKEC
ncbi:MAG: glycosyltransferase [Candidatus Omnitrophica bacterium]|nr:glycosyltransferase [Candidatus Omnitrophota bacterium]